MRIGTAGDDAQLKDHSKAARRELGQTIRFHQLGNRWCLSANLGPVIREVMMWLNTKEETTTWQQYCQTFCFFVASELMGVAHIARPMNRILGFDAQAEETRWLCSSCSLLYFREKEQVPNVSRKDTNCISPCVCVSRIQRRVHCTLSAASNKALLASLTVLGL